MLHGTCLSRTTIRIQPALKCCRTFSTRARPQVRAATHPYAQRRQQHFVRSIATVTALWATATAWQWYNGERIFREVHAEEPPQEEELVFEKPRRAASSEEDNRNIISSQHLQVTRSWEKPGVYAWGSNTGKVVAPDSDEVFIKTPRRIPFFDGVLLRDIKLDKNFGAAVDERGDLFQWGTDYSKDTTAPTRTLQGKNLTSIAISRDRIIGLSKSGAVYSVPVSQEEQRNGPKPASTSWIPFWGSSDNVSYRIRTPGSLGYNERVTNVVSGLEHALLLTSSGRVFSFASGTQNFPSKGQLGIPGLTWENRPEGSFDLPHEIKTLKGFPISKIAAGDYHSLVSDAAGRCFSFGDNSAGQLGFEFDADSLFIDAPSLLPTQRLYAGTAQQASVTNVFAGGNTSFITIEAQVPTAAIRAKERVTADAWAFGFGLTGQLGTGRWIHNQSTPMKIPTFSGLYEYDEDDNSVIPIRLAYLSVGANHAAAVMDNVASVSVSGKSRGQTQNDTNWGRDILFWGNNEFYQIGSGKRSNVSTPTYIQPLDIAAEHERVTGLTRGAKKADKEWHRFQITPKQKVKVGNRTVQLEQRVECGRSVTAVYSGV
ncbi:regulator of chromosome condensation 1/beta-lactamase-inhibitor protein II [Dendryphion nanum]|uniref:Regulator of chromosome condensation 1/beta-lactamase-inhibitor protein II n=1 Tax=Dendryphion nanum TaxID=256645 RepID=A0A9P9IZN5_9PLEO|nr:regulator of chromosome condensation 1/beta-lactamase-inhibitor protein II [Dendryphion nanum]